MHKKIISFTTKVITHELVTGTSLIFIGTMATNVFSFFFNLFLVRHFTYSQYGTYAALLSLITLVSIPSQSFQTIIVRFASSFLAKKDYSYAAAFFQKSLYIAGFFAATLAVLIIIFSSIIQNFLHIHDFFAIIFTGLVLASVYLTIPNAAFIQSMLQFQFLAFTTAIGGLLKLALGVLFVSLGFQVAGAFAGTLASFFIPFLLTFFPLRFLLRQKQKSVAFPVKEIITYAIPAMVAIISLSALTSTDLLLVKHFFPSNDAGLYAGVSLVGRIIFYFTAPIATVMFPLVIKRYQEKRNFHSLFFVAIFLVFLPSFFISIIYFLFPHIVIAIFLGGKAYQRMAPLVGLFGLYICVFSLVNVLVNFFLSLNKTRISWLVGAAALSQVVIISFVHQTFAQVIWISFIIVLVLFVLLLLYYAKSYVYKK